MKTWTNGYKLADVSAPLPFYGAYKFIIFHTKIPPFVSTLNKSISFYISPFPPTVLLRSFTILSHHPQAASNTVLLKFFPSPHAGHIPVPLLTLIAVQFDNQ
jgi:hypothetical protein